MALTKISGGVIKPDNFSVGVITATNITASTVASDSTMHVGSATTIHTTGIDLGSGNITANDATFSGDVNIAGVLTYEDVTNVDSVGLITARSGIHVTGGSVGIGSTQPTAKLDVFHTSNSESTAFFKNGGGSAPATVHIWEDNSSTLHYGLFVGKEDYTNPVLVTKQDKIGIGTDAPATNLTVYGGTSAALFQNSNTGTTGSDGFFVGNYGGLTASVWQYENDIIQFGTNNKERLRITGNGTFYLGGYLDSSTNNNTVKKIAVAPYNWTGGSTAEIASIEMGAPNTSSDDGNIIFKTATNVDSGGTLDEAMRIRYDGNVGIGTDAPWSKLSVHGDSITFGSGPSSSTNLGILQYNSQNGDLDLKAYSTGGNTFIRFHTSNSGTISEALRISNTGGVGIGTADPGVHKLYVNGPTLVEAPGNNAGTAQNSALYVKVPRNKISMFVGEYDSFTGAGANEYSGDIRFNGADIAWGDISYYPIGDGGAGSFRFTRNGSTVGSVPNARIGVGGIWMPGTGKITLNNGDAEIEGQSSYHLRVRTYDGSSDMRQMMKFYGGTSTGHVKIGGDSGISNGFTPLHFNSTNTINGYTHGGSTRFIGQIAPCNVGNSYLHVKIYVPGGIMFWVHSWGYTYAGGAIHDSQAVGYIYGTNLISTSVIDQNSNRGLAVYRASDGNLVMRIYAAHGTTNAWGYFGFEGGLDGITGIQADYCMRILAYTWSSSSAAQY